MVKLVKKRGPTSWTFDVFDESPDQAPHEMSIYISKGPSGAFVGHLKEAPEVIVQAETLDKLAKESAESIDLLWKSFPETHDKLYPDHVSAKEVVRKGFGFQQNLQAIEVTVPSF